MKTKLLVLLISLCGVASAQTNVSGGIFSNTTWIKANSPYIVTATVVVFPGVTLTIQPGVTVKFANAQQLEIRQAQLIALGTKTDSITFTSNSVSPVAGNWAGIYLNGGSLLSKFNFCNFKYAANLISTGGGINTIYVLSVKNSNIISNVNAFVCYLHLYIDSCNFRNNNVCTQTVCNATNCHVSNNNKGILTDNDSNGSSLVRNCIVDSNQVGITSGSLVSNCVIRYNQTGVSFAFTVDSCMITYNQVGANMDGGPGTISNCIVDSNVIVGIRSNGSQNRANDIINCKIRYNGIGIDDSQCMGSVITKNHIENDSIGILLNSYQEIISCNKICNNTSYDLKYKGINTISVSNNYWCTADSASTQAVIYDAHDNVSVGIVNYMPLDASCSPDISTSINAIESFTFDIYPNPTNGRFVIQSLEKNPSVEIMNVMGEEIYSSPQQYNSSTIDISSQPSGVYFLQLKTSEGITNKKIILQK